MYERRAACTLSYTLHFLSAHLHLPPTFSCRDDSWVGDMLTHVSCVLDRPCTYSYPLCICVLSNVTSAESDEGGMRKRRLRFQGQGWAGRVLLDHPCSLLGQVDTFACIETNVDLSKATSKAEQFHLVSTQHRQVAGCWKFC